MTIRSRAVWHDTTEADTAKLFHESQFDEGFRGDDFWRTLPAYARVHPKDFLDHRWQQLNTVTKLRQLGELVGASVGADFLADVEAGLARSTMSLRLPPYVVALIDWANAKTDPLRRQFIPLRSELRPDHPYSTIDSLAERAHAPVEGLTHRYRDRALLLALDTCPVYCRFCTRSYAIGLDTDILDKQHLPARPERWNAALRYIDEQHGIEDVLVSGGDVYQLRGEQLEALGQRLVNIPHVRRVRFATRGPAVMPMKLLSDEAWVDALVRIAERARKLSKQFMIHTHFNHPKEITGVTRTAIARLFQHAITVRNQTVLLRGVNDDATTLRTLVQRLSHINIEPYYVFQHDFVSGVEDLRTSVAQAQELEKQVRGFTSGYNTPTFAVDLPGGGGKRDIHSYEVYDRETGISIYRAPQKGPEALFAYFDPLHALSAEGQARWARAETHSTLLDAALEAARKVAAH